MDLELRHFAHYKNIYFIYIIIVREMTESEIENDQMTMTILTTCVCLFMILVDSFCSFS